MTPFGSLIHSARVARDVKTGNADLAAGAGNLHDRVQDRGRRLGGVGSLAAGFEADGVNSRVHFGLSDDLGDLLLQIALRNIDRLAAKAAGMSQPLGVEVADDNDCRTEE